MAELRTLAETRAEHEQLYIKAEAIKLAARIAARDYTESEERELREVRDRISELQQEAHRIMKKNGTCRIRIRVTRARRTNR
jgi:hypothetical protein